MVSLLLEGIFIFFKAELIHDHIFIFLLTNILCNSRLISTYRTDIVSLRPEHSPSVLILHIGMPFKNHKRALAL